MKSLGICLWCATLGAIWSGAAVCSSADEVATVARETNSEETLCRCAADTSPNTRRILETLSLPLKSTGLDFTEEPLENVAHFLQEEYGVPIQLDIQALEECGITSDEAMTVQIQNISLRSALRLLLESKGLVYMVRNEVLHITTPEQAEAELLTCVYDIRDLNSFLTRPDKSGQQIPDYDSLIDAIISCVAPETWAEAGGGEAEIRPLPPGLLVVSQTRTVHDEVAALLATIRETLELPAPASRVKVIIPAMGMEGPEGGMEDDPFSEREPTPAGDDLFK